MPRIPLTLRSWAQNYHPSLPLPSTNTSNHAVVVHQHHQRHSFTTTQSCPSSQKTPRPLPPRPPLLPPSEIESKALHGSGPGGQKINKTSSAIQLKHLPTGLVVKSQATRSRMQNMKIAQRLLADEVDVLRKGEGSRREVVRGIFSAKKRSQEKKRKRKYKKLAEEEGEEEGSEEYEEGNGDDGAEVAEAHTAVNQANPDQTNDPPPPPPLPTQQQQEQQQQPAQILQQLYNEIEKRKTGK